MSRTPVREALRRLQSDGLLEVGPRRQLLVVDVSPEHRREVTTLRVALEGAATAAACELRDEDDLDRLELLLLKQGRAAEAGDAETFLRLDEEFHLALAGAARMPTLSRMLDQLGAFVRLGRLGEATTTAHMRGLVGEHEELVSLLRSRRAGGSAPPSPPTSSRPAPRLTPVCFSPEGVRQQPARGQWTRPRREWRRERKASGRHTRWKDGGRPHSRTPR